LLNAIENLNRKKFKKTLSDEFVCEILHDNLDSDLQIVLSNESLHMKNSDSPSNEQNLRDSLNLKMSMSKNSTEANTLSFENSQMEALINQNVIDFEHILKMIVIGDKGVGKTSFIDRFVSDDNHKHKILGPTEWY
jgi:hypothetical protein